MSDTLDAILSLSVDERARLVMLSPTSVQIALFAFSFLDEMRNWLNDNNPVDEITPADKDEIDALVAQLMVEIMTAELGYIAPYMTALPLDGWLACDGSTFLRADYPDLYALLDSSFIVDSDHFVTPDLRGRTIIGAGTGSGLTPRTVADLGGEENHLLTVAESASHSHGQADPTVIDGGHVHSEAGTLPTAITIGAGVPAPSALPSPSITGLATTGISVIEAGIDNTGGDEAHNTMQPWLALNYAVRAI